MSYQIQLNETYPALKRSKNNLIHVGLNQEIIEFDGWHLPGQKEKRSDCGKWSFMGCMNTELHPNGKIFLKPFQKSCFRADCELCCFKWAYRSASKATKRMETYEKQSKKIAKHIIISLPVWDHYLPKKEMAKKVYAVLRDVNAKSGLVIYHPFRYDKSRNVWYYFPHYHCIGFDWIENVVETYNKSGYVIKNLGKRKSLFGTIHYQLSHCGIKKHNHSLVYFGDCSYSKLKVEEEEENDRKCPFCQEDLQELDYYSDSGLEPDPNIATTGLLIECFSWFLKTPYQKI